MITKRYRRAETSLASRVAARLAGLAVALLPLVPAPLDTAPRGPVAGDGALVAPPTAPDAALASDGGTAPPPAVAIEVAPPAPDAGGSAGPTDEHPSGPGVVRIEAGAVRVVQE